MAMALRYHRARLSAKRRHRQQDYLLCAEKTVRDERGVDGKAGQRFNRIVANDENRMGMLF